MIIIFDYYCLVEIVFFIGSAESYTTIDKTFAVVPEFENRMSRFDKKLRIAQYATYSQTHHTTIS